MLKLHKNLSLLTKSRRLRKDNFLGVEIDKENVNNLPYECIDAPEIAALSERLHKRLHVFDLVANLAGLEALEERGPSAVAGFEWGVPKVEALPIRETRGVEA